MRNLSKSKIIAFRQCPKRFWLEIHRPELRDDSSSEVVFAIGNQVGEIAQEIYNTDGSGVLINIDKLGFPAVFEETNKHINKGTSIIFEAAMQANRALALADVMMPNTENEDLHWDMIEVKSSTKVKDYHHDDVAVQSYIAAASGLKLSSVSLAHINNQFIYQGGDDYQGLLTREDLTDEAMSRHNEVEAWLQDAHKVADLPTEPDTATGAQCSDPFDCPFIAHCNEGIDQPEFPLSSLPRFHRDRKQDLEQQGITDLRMVPDGYLNDKQLMVKHHTVAETTFFDAKGAARELSKATVKEAPHYFLDFETSMTAIPKLIGTKPYQQIPFQFSLHTLQEDGTLDQVTFLDLSGQDPRRKCAETLINTCGHSGPIFVYFMAFEKSVINTLAEAFPDLSSMLYAIVDRIVDLLRVVRSGASSLFLVLP